MTVVIQLNYSVGSLFGWVWVTRENDHIYLFCCDCENANNLLSVFGFYIPICRSGGGGNGSDVVEEIDDNSILISSGGIYDSMKSNSNEEGKGLEEMENLDKTALPNGDNDEKLALRDKLMNKMYPKMRRIPKRHHILIGFQYFKTNQSI